MDILEYWHPDIAWYQFDQGPISDGAWDCFKKVVLLCHAFRHWEEDVQRKQLSPPKSKDKRQFEKRREQWESDIRRSEKHRDRARFLADQKIVELSYLGINADGAQGTADWKLWSALRTVVSAHPQAVAFESFDGGREIKDEAAQIALRWLGAARSINAE